MYYVYITPRQHITECRADKTRPGLLVTHASGGGRAARQISDWFYAVATATKSFSPLGAAGRDSRCNKTFITADSELVYDQRF